MARIPIARMLLTSALAALVIQPVSQARADAVTDWNVIAVNATAVPPNSILQSRVLAIVHGAIYDAVRAVEQKGAAVDLKIPTLEGDPNWKPLLVTPPQPDYPSAHCIFSGAAEAVLRGFFGSDDVNVSVTFPAPLGVTRTYRKFSAMMEEVENARVWGGIHFRSADKDGSDVGRKIGAIVVRDFPKALGN